MENYTYLKEFVVMFSLVVDGSHREGVDIVEGDLEIQQRKKVGIIISAIAHTVLLRISKHFPTLSKVAASSAGANPHNFPNCCTT